MITIKEIADQLGVCWRGLTGNCENTIALWSAER